MEQNLNQIPTQENPENSDELMHYGVLGMKWGVRRYQPKKSGGGSSVVKKSKKMGVIESYKKKKKAKNVAEQRRQNVEKAREGRKKQIEYKKEADRVLKEGSATEVLKYKKAYTTKQLQDAANRIQWTQKLEEYSAKEQRSTMDKVDKYMKKVKTVNEWVDTGLTTKKNAEKIMKLLDEGAEQAAKKNKKKKDK